MHGSTAPGLVPSPEGGGVGVAPVAPVAPPPPGHANELRGRRVLMLVYNNCAADVRVLKEAGTLTGAGAEVAVVAVLDRVTTAEEQRDGVTILRIDRRPLHYKLLWSTRKLRRRLRLANGRRRLRGQRLAKKLERKSSAARREGGAVGTAKRGGLVGARLFAGSVVGVPLVVARTIGPLATRIDETVGGLSKRALMAFHKPLMFSDWYWRAYRLGVDRGADVVHAHDLNTLVAGALISRKLRIPLVYDAHELYSEISTLGSTERRIWRVLERRLIRRAAEVITVCESIAGELETRYAVTRPGVVLNCPPRPDVAALDGAPERLRERVGLLDDPRPVVLYQGGFAPNRGLLELVEAMALVDDGVLVMMGWGKLEPALRGRITELGIEDRVRLTPGVPQAELLAHTTGADVGVIPYIPIGLNNYYTTPNKLFEYLAAGVAVAGSDLPELRRFITADALGGTFEPGSALDMARAISAMLADRAELAAMGRRASDAGQRLCWEEQEPLLLSSYSRALDGQPAPAPRRT